MKITLYNDSYQFWYLKITNVISKTRIKLGNNTGEHSN